METNLSLDPDDSNSPSVDALRAALAGGDSIVTTDHAPGLKKLGISRSLASRWQ